MAFDKMKVGHFPSTLKVMRAAWQVWPENHQPVTSDWSFTQVNRSVSDCHQMRWSWLPSLFLMPVWYLSSLLLRQLSSLERQKGCASCASRERACVAEKEKPMWECDPFPWHTAGVLPSTTAHSFTRLTVLGLGTGHQTKIPSEPKPLISSCWK